MTTSQSGPDAASLRMYTDLAPWWPLISPADAYVDDAAMIAGIMTAARPSTRRVLQLGAGGGHLAVHLAESFELTLLDLAEPMLDASRLLNPTVEHVHADMRTVRLGREFDAVLVYDAVDYLLSEDDLAATFATARTHLRPGGVLVLVPDFVAESFTPGEDVGGVDGVDGRAARYLAWRWDPDPSDTWLQTDYALLLRDADGAVTTASETHRTGLFPRATWIELLTDAGFEVSVVDEHREDEPARSVFVGVASPDGG